MWYVGNRLLWLGLPLFCAGIFGVPSIYADEARNLAGQVVSTGGIVFVRPDVRDNTWKPTPAKPGDKVYANDVINTSSNGSIKILLSDKTIIDLGPSALFKVDRYVGGSGTDRQAEVSMMYGTVRGAVTQKITGNGKFRLRTPTATMGVRGTEFVVATQAPTDMKSMGDAISGKKAPNSPTAGGSKGSPGAANGGGQPSGAPPVVQTQITVLQGKVDVAKSDKALDASSRGLASGKGGGGTVALTAGQQITSSSTGAMPAQTQVTTLSTAQLTTVTAAATVTDNTFSKAVVLNLNTSAGGGPSPTAGGGPGGAASGGPSGGVAPTGLATLAEVSTAVAANTITAAPTVTVSDIGLAGTFGAANTTAPAPFVHTGVHSVTVTIVQK